MCKGGNVLYCLDLIEDNGGEVDLCELNLVFHKGRISCQDPANLVLRITDGIETKINVFSPIVLLLLKCLEVSPVSINAHAERRFITIHMVFDFLCPVSQKGCWCHD